MKNSTAFALVLACLLTAGQAIAADKKDKTLLDMKAVQLDNVSPNSKHMTMGSLGDRVHGGAFGPWRCQVKVLDRREMNARMKEADTDKSGRTPSTHMVSLSIMDPASGKGVTAGKGTVTATGPDKKKATAELQQVGGPFLADLELKGKGDYAILVEFSSGKQKASAKFSYNVK